jgi:YD repeat-containing protein
MKYISRIIFFAFSLFSLACTHQRNVNFNATNFDTGESLQAYYNNSSKLVSITMPDGEVLIGEFTKINEKAFSFGNRQQSIIVGKSGKVYVLLKSQKSNSKLMMEIIASFSGTHGFGEGKTNDGRTYIIQF